MVAGARQSLDTQTTAAHTSRTPSAGPTATARATSSVDRAATYLCDVDHHAHSREQDTALLTELARHCTDDPLALSEAAKDTATTVTGNLTRGATDDAYGVLTQLRRDTENSSGLDCRAKLPAIPAQLAPPPHTARPTPHPTVRHTAAPRPTPSPTRSTPAPAVHRTTASAGPPVILSPSGNYYRAGEFCPTRDAGLSTVDAHGNVITCGLESGRYHWHY
jgi:hypothetical protein